MFLDDQYNFRFRHNRGFKMTRFFYVFVLGLPHSHVRVQGFFMDIETFLSLNCPECKTVHKITNAMLFLENVGDYFLLGQNT